MLTGQILKAARKALGMTQSELAAAIGYHRCTVVYWEGKGIISGRPFNALKDMIQVLELKDYCTPNARARTWGIRDSQQEAVDRMAEERLKEEYARASLQASRRRVMCGAKTRKGHPCKRVSEASRRRCKFHGGMSTGPKTEEGKARIAEAQRRRWARYRGD